MINVLSIKTNVFDTEKVVAEIYKDSYQVAKTFIKPFKEEMKKANNIILFVDDNYNITGGQIGLYDHEKGLRVELF